MILRSLPMTDFSAVGLRGGRAKGASVPFRLDDRWSSTFGSTEELRVNIKAPINENKRYGKAAPKGNSAPRHGGIVSGKAAASGVESAGRATRNQEEIRILG